MDLTTLETVLNAVIIGLTGGLILASAIVPTALAIMFVIWLSDRV